MRNLGIYFPKPLSREDVASLGVSLGGRPMSDSTQLFGEPPEAAYLDPETDLTNGCFDDDELNQLAATLGFQPASYVSVHMSSTEAGYREALRVATALSERWCGKIDYSGVGGAK